MSESPGKQTRNRLIVALAILFLLMLSCVVGLPILILGVKFGWPKIRGRFYHGPVPLRDSGNGAG